MTLTSPSPSPAHKSPSLSGNPAAGIPKANVPSTLCAAIYVRCSLSFPTISLSLPVEFSAHVHQIQHPAHTNTLSAFPTFPYPFSTYASDDAHPIPLLIDHSDVSDRPYAVEYAVGHVSDLVSGCPAERGRKVCARVWANNRVLGCGRGHGHGHDRGSYRGGGHRARGG